MALPAELVRPAPHGIEYRPRSWEKPHALPWRKLRAISAEVQPAWAGAEVSLDLAFDGDGAANDAVPLARGMRLKVFGDFAAGRALIAAARQQAPQALVGPQAELLMGLPRPDGDSEQALRAQLKQYGFAAAAGLSLGKLLLWRGRLERADNAFQRAAARAPLDADAWRWLGLTRLFLGRGDDAQQVLDRLVSLGARDPDTQYLRALSLYRQRRFPQAAEVFSAVLRARTADPGLRDLLACSLVQQWRVQEALAELDTVGADGREGWRLMAQKCRLCAQGYRAYQERMSADRWFRWGERWRGVAARMAGLVGGMVGFMSSMRFRHGWVGAIVLLLAALGEYFMVGRWREQHRVRDRLADAQGQAPNMPCWYGQGRRKPTTVRRSIMNAMLRRWGVEG